MNTKRLHLHSACESSHLGFTLVEMLVSVSLVLLMMTLFAGIFQMASSSVSIQRGISETDQRARSIQTVIKADLDKRTDRSVLPFMANESANISPFDFDNRRGYVYVSANSLDDGADDVLQFTMDAAIETKNTDTTDFFGRAGQVLTPAFVIPADSDISSTSGIDESTTPINENLLNALVSDLVNHPNQPEADDGDVSPNQTTRSHAAEVSYFVRDRKLIRRVLLIRDPLQLAGQELSAQPDRNDPVNPFDSDGDLTTYVYGRSNGAFDASAAIVSTDDFWRDFDFSAYRLYTGATPSHAQIHGIDALNNAPTGSTFFSLGKPNFRFGYDTVSGQPREHTTAGEVFGRFTHGETSAINFNYPQGPSYVKGTTDIAGTPGTLLGSSGLANPFDSTDVTLSFSATNPGVIDEFDSTTPVGDQIRRAEDVLLANVHEFRVEIFDDRLGLYASPGHWQAHPGVDGIRGNGDDVFGDYHIARRQNPSYGSLRAAGRGVDAAPNRNRVFDSWHPNVNSVGAVVGPLSNSVAPFRAMGFYPPGHAIGPYAPNGTWTPSTDNINLNSYSVGDIVFARTEDLNGDGVFDAPNEDGMVAGWDPTPGALDSETPGYDYGFYFQCVRAGNAGTVAPAWQLREGALITENNSDGFTPDLPQASMAVWRAVQNVRPLRSLRITIRFLHPSTEQMRQVTLIHSLVD